MGRRAWRCAMAVAWMLVGCDSEVPPPQVGSETKAVPNDGTAQRKLQREQKAAEAAREQAAQTAAIDALAALPTKLPKTLAQACQQMTAAYDAFMRKVLVGDMLTKWTTGGNEMQIAVFRKECLQRSIEVAACQTHALGKAAPELHPELATVMGRCAEKFGGTKPGG